MNEYTLMVLMSSNAEDQQKMIELLAEASENVYLEMNLENTKVMSPDDVQITVKNETLEKIIEYVYLGQLMKLGMENQSAEIGRSSSWAAWKSYFNI